MLWGFRLAAACAALALVGCYRPSYESCALRCDQASGCPSDLTCQGGFCVGPGVAACGGDPDAGDAASDDAAPGAGFVQLAAGNRHACGIDGDGALACWGNNARGQLGRAAPMRSGVPAAPVGGPTTGWTSVAAGRNHTCGVAAGAVHCWGSGESYQTTHATSPTPTLIEPGEATGTGTWLRVTAGADHTCALRSEPRGTVGYCWGAGADGQLGDAGATTRSTPVAIVDAGGQPITDWSQLEAGGRHTCGTRVDGSVWCWGADDQRQLGGATAGPASRPQRVVALTSVATALSAGEDATCAIDGTGELWCWGSNAWGQLGLGMPRTLAPTRIPSAGNRVTAVALGLDHACIQADGQVRCAGAGQLGQLGIGTWTDRATFAGAAIDAAGLRTLTAGTQFACLATANGASCWGKDSDGQLGTGTIATKWVPVQVGGDARWTAVAAGRSHTCAIRGDADGSGPLDEAALYCWGWDVTGQLGATGDALTPRLTDASLRWLEVDAGDGFACGVAGPMGSAALYCWGNNAEFRTGLGIATLYTPTPTQVGATLAAPVRDLTLGARHGCVSAGTERACWGSNPDGVWLGGGAGLGSPGAPTGAGAAPRQSALGEAFGILVGGMSSSVFTWGTNERGQTGQGMAAAATATPVSLGFTALDAPGTVTAALGGAHACAITSAGELRCWGDGGLGQVGNGALATAYTPAVITPTGGLSGSWTRVSAGQSFTCAITTTQVYCWGDPAEGQVGNQTITVVNPVSRPVVVTGAGAGWKALSTGFQHACAIDAADHLWCWGNNIHGQIGDGTAYRAAPAPVQPPS